MFVEEMIVRRFVIAYAPDFRMRREPESLALSLSFFSISHTGKESRKGGFARPRMLSVRAVAASLLAASFARL